MIDNVYSYKAIVSLMDMIFGLIRCSFYVGKNNIVFHANPSMKKQDDGVGRLRVCQYYTGALLSCKQSNQEAGSFFLLSSACEFFGVWVGYSAVDIEVALLVLSSLTV